MATLIIAGVLLALMAFPSWRLEMFKPEHSTYKLLMYIIVWKVFDLFVGSLREYSGLEQVGLVTLTCVIGIPVLMLGEYYTRKWWTVQESDK